MFGPSDLSSNACRWPCVVTNSSTQGSTKSSTAHSGQHQVQHCPLRAAPSPTLPLITGSRCFIQISTSRRHCLDCCPDFSQSGDRKFHMRCCPWYTKQHGQSILNFIEIELQQILNYSWMSHKYNCPSKTYFKTDKMRVHHKLLNTDRPSRPKCWQSTTGPKWTQPKRYLQTVTLQIKISAVSVFLEANHHSIITHLITIDKSIKKDT